VRKRTSEAETHPHINDEVAGRLEAMAALLAGQDAEDVRVRAYRRAAGTLRALDRSVATIATESGLPGLMLLDGVGRGIGLAIMEIVATGHWGQLDRLAGQVDPVALFCTLPGIGEELAERLHDDLDIDDLPGLENAIADGRAARVRGMGPRRLAMLQAELADRLGGARTQAGSVHPPVSLILDVDEEYRRRALAGDLPRIAPRRFNPSGEAWLPVLHTRRGDWNFTAMFSNSRRAQEFGRTGDWVVIHARLDDVPEGQFTVVTETRGPLADRRVIRGREGECIAHYVQN
jgi:putative hydrolase